MTKRIFIEKFNANYLKARGVKGSGEQLTSMVVTTIVPPETREEELVPFTMPSHLRFEGVIGVIALGSINENRHGKWYIKN